VSVRCHIFKLKCTKFDFGWGFAPDLAGGTYSTPHIAKLDSSGLILREGEVAREDGKGLITVY